MSPRYLGLCLRSQSPRNSNKHLGGWHIGTRSIDFCCHLRKSHLTTWPPFLCHKNLTLLWPRAGCKNTAERNCAQANVLKTFGVTLLNETWWSTVLPHPSPCPCNDQHHFSSRISLCSEFLRRRCREVRTNNFSSQQIVPHSRGKTRGKSTLPHE